MTNHTVRIRGFVGIIVSMPFAIVAAKSAPILSLKNKSGSSIQVQIKNALNEPIGPLVTVEANMNYEPKNSDLDDSAIWVNSMKIYYCPTKDYCKKNKPDVLVASFLGMYDTMYLKFSIKDGKGRLEVQKGSGNKTTDGYSLAKNIKQKEIQQKLEHTGTISIDQKIIAEQAKAEADAAKAKAKARVEANLKAWTETQQKN